MRMISAGPVAMARIGNVMLHVMTCIFLRGRVVIVRMTVVIVNSMLDVLARDPARLLSLIHI